MEEQKNENRNIEKTEKEKIRAEIIDEVEKNTIIAILQNLEMNIARKSIEIETLQSMYKSYEEMITNKNKK